MKFKIISTGNIVVADEAFMQAHHAGDYEEVSDFPASAPAVTLALTADKMEAAVNEVITISASFNVPITATFSVPIEDGNGLVVKIKAVSFVNGEATVQLAFDKSGYYCLTQDGINRKLPADQQIVLPETFELTVYE